MARISLINKLREALVKAIDEASRIDVQKTAANLVEAGGGLDFKLPMKSSTPLGRAAFNLDAPICRILLNAGADHRNKEWGYGAFETWTLAALAANEKPQMRGQPQRHADGQCHTNFRGYKGHPDQR